MKMKAQDLFYFTGHGDLVMWANEALSQYENYGGKDKLYGAGGQQYLWGRVRLM